MQLASADIARSTFCPATCKRQTLVRRTARLLPVRTDLFERLAATRARSPRLRGFSTRAGNSGPASRRRTIEMKTIRPVLCTLARATLVTAALAPLLLAGCGGGSDDSTAARGTSSVEV